MRTASQRSVRLGDAAAIIWITRLASALLPFKTNFHLVIALRRSGAASED